MDGHFLSIDSCNGLSEILPVSGWSTFTGHALPLGRTVARPSRGTTSYRAMNPQTEIKLSFIRLSRLALSRWFKTCPTCGADFMWNHSDQVFCSHKCNYRQPKQWLADAIRMYLSGIGCKRIGRVLGVKANTVLGQIKKTPHFQAGRETKMPRWNKGNRNKANPDKIIASHYASEMRVIKRGDELNHWGNHPEMEKYRIVDGRMIRASRLQYQRGKAKRSNYHLAKLIRSRVYRALKGQLKSAPTLKLLGCSIEHFRLHIQRQFKRGMNWNNHGKVWQIDHIIPCAAFDMRDPEQQRKCFHYTNQQPLRCTDNLVKHDRIVPCQPELAISL